MIIPLRLCIVKLGKKVMQKGYFSCKKITKPSQPNPGTVFRCLHSPLTPVFLSPCPYRSIHIPSDPWKHIRYNRRPNRVEHPPPVSPAGPQHPHFHGPPQPRSGHQLLPPLQRLHTDCRALVRRLCLVAFLQLLCYTGLNRVLRRERGRRDGGGEEGVGFNLRVRRRVKCKLLREAVR